MRRFILLLVLVPLFVLAGNVSVQPPSASAVANLSKWDVFPYEKGDLQVRVDYSGANPIYVGYAQPDALYTDAKWQIIKILYSGSNVVGTVYADGTNQYIKVWNNRTGYTYASQ
jgi:hypothetical protein